MELTSNALDFFNVLSGKVVEDRITIVELGLVDYSDDQKIKHLTLQCHKAFFLKSFHEAERYGTRALSFSTQKFLVQKELQWAALCVDKAKAMQGSVSQKASFKHLSPIKMPTKNYEYFLQKLYSSYPYPL